MHNVEILKQSLEKVRHHNAAIQAGLWAIIGEREAAIAELTEANAKLAEIAEAARATPDWLAVCRALVADVMNLGSHSVTCRQSVQDAREAVAEAEDQEQERIAGGKDGG